MANNNIFIVDASPNSRLILEQELRKLGHHVFGTDNYDQAVEQLSHTTPDLIVSDIKFGDDTPDDKDGFALLNYVRSVNETKDVPFLFLTEHKSLDNTIKAFGAGAEDVIGKPMKLSEIIPRIKLLLNTDNDSSKSSSSKTSDVLPNPPSTGAFEPESSSPMLGAHAPSVVSTIERMEERYQLVGLLDRFARKEKSAQIEVTDGTYRAWISFKNGEVTGCVFGNLIGFAALSKIDLWRKINVLDGDSKTEPPLQLMSTTVLDRPGDLSQLLKSSRDSFEENSVKLPSLKTVVVLNEEEAAKDTRPVPMKRQIIGVVRDQEISLYDIFQKIDREPSITVQSLVKMLDDKVLSVVKGSVERRAKSFPSASASNKSSEAALFDDIDEAYHLPDAFSSVEDVTPLPGGGRPRLAQSSQVFDRLPENEDSGWTFFFDKQEDENELRRLTGSIEGPWGIGFNSDAEPITSPRVSSIFSPVDSDKGESENEFAFPPIVSGDKKLSVAQLAMLQKKYANRPRHSTSPLVNKSDSGQSDKFDLNTHSLIENTERPFSIEQQSEAAEVTINRFINHRPSRTGYEEPPISKKEIEEGAQTKKDSKIIDLESDDDFQEEITARKRIANFEGTPKKKLHQKALDSEDDLKLEYDAFFDDDISNDELLDSLLNEVGNPDEESSIVDTSPYSDPDILSEHSVSDSFLDSDKLSNRQTALGNENRKTSHGKELRTTGGHLKSELDHLNTRRLIRRKLDLHRQNPQNPEYSQPISRINIDLNELSNPGERLHPKINHHADNSDPNSANKRSLDTIDDKRSDFIDNVDSDHNNDPNSTNDHSLDTIDDKRSDFIDKNDLDHDSNKNYKTSDDSSLKTAEELRVFLDDGDSDLEDSLDPFSPHFPDEIGQPHFITIDDSSELKTSQPEQKEEHPEVTEIVPSRSSRLANDKLAFQHSRNLLITWILFGMLFGAIFISVVAIFHDPNSRMGNSSRPSSTDVTIQSPANYRDPNAPKEQPPTPFPLNIRSPGQPSGTDANDLKPGDLEPVDKKNLDQQPLKLPNEETKNEKSDIDAAIDSFSSNMKGRPDNETIAMLDDLEREYPDNGRLQFFKGQLFSKAGRDIDAINAYRRAINLGYRTADTYYGLANSYLQINDNDHARDTYKLFLEKEPSGRRADRARILIENRL